MQPNWGYWSHEWRFKNSPLRQPKPRRRRPSASSQRSRYNSTKPLMANIISDHPRQSLPVYHLCLCRVVLVLATGASNSLWLAADKIYASDGPSSKKNSGFSNFSCPTILPTIQSPVCIFFNSSHGNVFPACCLMQSLRL